MKNITFLVTGNSTGFPIYRRSAAQGDRVRLPVEFNLENI